MAAEVTFIKVVLLCPRARCARAAHPKRDTQNLNFLFMCSATITAYSRDDYRKSDGAPLPKPKPQRRSGREIARIAKIAVIAKIEGQNR
jgi:hypothetical protein